METFTSLQPYLKVLFPFALMLVGIRNGLGIALSIFLGGGAMGLLCGLSVLEWLNTAQLALVQDKFLFLVTIVGLILIFSGGLQRSGQSERLTEALSGFLVRPRMRLLFFPALIGLLPMPGGAVFSAPMVKTVSQEMDLTGEDKVVINYWFRHVWEMAWPLYPGIILTVALAEITIGQFISKSWPGVAAMFVIGWFFFLRGLQFNKRQRRRDMDLVHPWKEVLLAGLPLIIAICGAVGLETFIAKYMPGVSFEWGVITAMTIAIGCLFIQNRLGLGYVVEVLKTKSLWSMMMVIAAIFIFKDIMQAAGIVDQMAAAAGSGVALFSAAVFLPFLVGMVAGINVAFVGATFPLLIGLIDSLGLQPQLIPYLVLASFCGFTGVMISPIHICFVLTCKFFETNLAAAWRRMVLPCLCFGFFGGLLFLVLIR